MKAVVLQDGVGENDISEYAFWTQITYKIYLTAK